MFSNSRASTAVLEVLTHSLSTPSTVTGAPVQEDGGQYAGPQRSGLATFKLPYPGTKACPRAYPGYALGRNAHVREDEQPHEQSHLLIDDTIPVGE